MNNRHNAPAPWANPTPAGLVALAVACFLFFPYLTGRVGKIPGEFSAMPLMAAWLFAGFVVQLVVALCDLKSGNAAGGCTFLYFSAFFMLAGSLSFMMKSFAPGLDTRIEGYAWVVLSATVILWAPAFFKGSSLLFLIILSLCVACPMVAICDLQLLPAAAATVCANVAGWSMLIGGIIGIYLAAVLIVNGAYGRDIFPNPAPFYKEKAFPVEAPLAAED